MFLFYLVDMFLQLGRDYGPYYTQKESTVLLTSIVILDPTQVSFFPGL